MESREKSVKVFFYDPLTHAGRAFHSGRMSNDLTVWVRLDAATARELDQYVRRERTIRKNRIDLRAMSRSTAIREGVLLLLERERERLRRERAAEPDPRQVAVPGIDQ